ncbi:hypothetical protein QIA41_05785 (plasmid) [Borreliella sinica]|uniref:hypothetical protein n=1 Tax=Borreliella sinica TaxID=87162 RepID=UPI003AEF2DB2
MNKKMFIVCAVFALISSCKNHADLKQGVEDSVKNTEQQIKGFLDIKKEELNEGLKNPGSEVSVKVQKKIIQADEPQGQVQEQVDQEVETLKKKIEELKEKIEKADDKTSLKAYCEYEKEIKKLKEELEKKLKDKKEDKEKLEKELETLKKTLKEKIEKRKKELEAAQKKFQEYKQQVESATGQSEGHRAGNQGRVGAQAWSEAQKLGLRVGNSNNDDTDTSDMSKGIIDSALKKIEEELKEIKEEYES